MNTLEKIQQDIESLSERINKAYADMHGANFGSKATIHATISHVFIQQYDLAKLLLRLSNIKPTGLWPSSANDESETPPPKPTLRELSKNGQKVRRPFWKPDEYIIVSDSGEVVGGSIATESVCGAYAQLDKCGWERYEEKPKTTGLSFLEAAKNGQMARRPHWEPNTYIFFDEGQHSDYKLHDNNGEFASWLTRDDYYANDWEIYEVKESESIKTITGYEAAKLVIEGKTVKRLSSPWIYARHRNTVLGLSKENLEADDWIEVEE